MRIVVTGGAGYIGAITVRHLLAAGHDVRVLDSLVRGHRESVPEGLLDVVDVRDTVAVASALRRHGAEAVMHFAALALVGESVEDPGPYWSVNVGGTVSLLAAMRAVGVPALVFSGTCAVYGIPDVVPIPEQATLRPINPYGASKAAAERAIADHAAAHGLGAAVLRYFNAAGAARDGSLGEAHDPETHLVPLLLEVAAGRRPAATLHGEDWPTPDGTCVRDYVHVDDLADAHIRALGAIEPGRVRTWNVGTGRGHSVREVLDAARRATGHPIPAEVGPRRAGDPAALVASGAAIRRDLGWEPLASDLDTIVGSAWRWRAARDLRS